METQIQKPGVRKWYADDLLKLQDEIYKALQIGALGEVNNVILNGVEADDLGGGEFEITEGYCIIGNKIVWFEGIENTTLPQYLFLDCIETNNKEYADGISKPTELKCIARITDTQPSGDFIKLADDSNDKSRLLLPRYATNGALFGLPKHNSYSLNEENILATSKAVNDLYDKVNRRYLKENYDNGEIDQLLIPVGHLWIGKNGLIKINDQGNMALESLEANAEIIGTTLEGDLVYSNGQIVAIGNIETGGYFEGANAAKILLHIESDGAGIISSKGSIALGSADVTDGGTGMCTINVVVPTDAILMVSAQAPAFHSRISRHPTNGNPLVETFDSNNNYIDAETHVSIYY